MTDEQFEKLPKFARDEIEKLRQQRDTAVAALKKWADEQTPSPISIIEAECIESGGPTLMTRYIQGRRINFVHAGVSLDVYLSSEGGTHMGGIDLKWGCHHGSMDAIAMVPKSYQNVELISKKYMR